MFQRHRGKHHKQIHLCLFFLDGKHREPQSINAKLFLPIIPIGIVAYALTLLWDNLCRNSCMFQGDNKIYRCIATTASKKLKIGLENLCSVIRSSHRTFQTDDRFVACLGQKTAYPEVLICLKV